MENLIWQGRLSLPKQRKDEGRAHKRLTIMIKIQFGVNCSEKEGGFF